MRPLSIAMFGNTNNYPLLLAQGFRHNGHHVRLLVNRKELLHRPEARYPAWAGAYPEWIVDCSDVTDEDIAFETPALNWLKEQLGAGVNLAILNDIGPALACTLNAPHVVVLTGSDLAYFANFDMLAMRSSSWSPDFKRSSEGRYYMRRWADLVARQRDGILGAEVVCYGQRGLVPTGDRMLDDIGVEDARRFMIHFSNTIDLHVRAAPRNSRLTILCGSRLVFRPDLHPAMSAMDFKGTDVLIKGFALYRHRGGAGVLCLFRKGQDLPVAEALIRELGIADGIRWLQEMPLAEFYQEMAAADLVCDQFGSSFPGMVTTDAYALGRPVMANLRPDIFTRRFPEPLPGFHAETPEQVADHLLRLDAHRDLLEEMGATSRAYAEKYLSPESMAEQLLLRVAEARPNWWRRLMAAS